MKNRLTGLPFVTCLTSVTLLLTVCAHAAQTTGGVTWLDPLQYAKPPFVPLTVPDEGTATKYYIDMSAGSDGSSCGTQGSPCRTLRGLANRNLMGLRGNAGDAAAYVYVRGNGLFYLYNDTFAGTPGKEIVIKPWGTSVSTFNAGSGNQGISGANVHDIIIDGGDPATGQVLFVFTRTGLSGQSYVMSNNMSNLTMARCRFTENVAGATLVGHCGYDGLYCTNIRYINNEFYDCADGSIQCSALYVGPCSASGGCHADNVLFKNNIVRNVGGEGIEMNPRTTSTNYLIEGNAFHTVGYRTCTGGWNCRPAITLNINQSGALNQAVVRNNLMWDISSGCVWARTGATGTNAPVIYNNTCFDYGKGTGGSGDPQPQGISTYTGGGTAIVRNNILFAPNGTNPFDHSSFTASHNLCGSGKSCGSSSRVWSANSVLSTQSNINTFLQIGSASEALNTGTSVSGVTIDYLGTARPQGSAYDIGAFEYTGGTPPPPPPSGSVCDINTDGSTNVADVQLCANQAIGVTACSTGDINDDSQCNVIDVQRTVNAALGGPCITNP